MSIEKMEKHVADIKRLKLRKSRLENLFRESVKITKAEVKIAYTNNGSSAELITIPTEDAIAMFKAKLQAVTREINRRETVFQTQMRMGILDDEE